MPATDTASEARAFMRVHEHEPIHAEQVTRLALQIFDQLQAVHRLEPRQRELLEAASLLHDTGWSVAVNGSAHHKESAKLIRSFSWTTLKKDEIDLVAQIARYHRKKMPTEEHAPFAALSPDQKKIVRSCAALLRVADAFDRSHVSIVHRIDLRKTVRGWMAGLTSPESCVSEIAAFEKKRDLFEHHFATPIDAEVTAD